MRLRCGDALVDVELRPEGGAWEARVDGQPLRLSLEAAGEGSWLVRPPSGPPQRLHVARDGRTLHLFWEGVAYRLVEEREGAPATSRRDLGALEAPMPGRVSAVRVTVGQLVAKGDELLVVEAMKMENALRSPRDGVVRAVNVSAGEMVAPGRPLVEIAGTEAPA
jgi:3-methylcrotonyl-CoA carboxylase alpha subunit